MSDYHGYTHLHLTWVGNAVWRRVFCPRGWHLWDEVLSGLHERHYLSCDACGATQELP